MTANSATIVLDVAPVRAQPAGVGLYVARLATALVAAAPMPIGLIGARPEASALARLDPGIPRRPLRKSSYHSWMQLSAERDARALGARLVHFTNAAAPVFGRLPYVLTIHDLSVARMPLTHPIARWSIVPVNMISTARARMIIVPSRFTARELARIGVSPQRVVVIPHAAALAAPTGKHEVLAQLGLESGGYLLYFGTIEPRKNLARVVEAFERLADDRPDLRLVLAGARGWHYRGIEQRVASSSVSDRIVMPGYVDDNDLAALIADSAAVVYASLYEGFGMPVLDAMALGAPVVTSRTTAMPEAAHGAAVLVDPLDVVDIARGISQALARHAELAERGRRLGTKRTWAQVAAEHADVYRHVLRVLDG